MLSSTEHQFDIACVHREGEEKGKKISLSYHRRAGRDECFLYFKAECQSVKDGIVIFPIKVL